MLMSAVNSMARTSSCHVIFCQAKPRAQTVERLGSLKLSKVNKVISRDKLATTIVKIFRLLVTINVLSNTFIDVVLREA